MKEIIEYYSIGENDQLTNVSLKNGEIMLLNHDEQMYLIDTGFGGKLPLKPVPLFGETISSYNGEFQIKKVNHENGDYCLQIKLKHKDTDWKIGYAFDFQEFI